jgi:hypothetical protein
MGLVAAGSWFRKVELVPTFVCREADGFGPADLNHLSCKNFQNSSLWVRKNSFSPIFSIWFQGLTSRNLFEALDENRSSSFWMWDRYSNFGVFIWGVEHSEIYAQLDCVFSKHSATIAVLMIVQNHEDHEIQFQFHSPNFVWYQSMSWFEYSYLDRAIIKKSWLTSTTCQLFPLPLDSVKTLWTTLVFMTQIHYYILFESKMVAKLTSISRFNAIC